MIDVLFIYTNINGFHSDTYCFGIGYLSAVLKEKGFSTRLVVVSSVKEYKNILTAVKKLRPKIIGLTAVSSQFIFVSDIAKIIKEIHNCIIVCGGVHPTIFSDCLLITPQFDGLFIGESELSFLEFVSKVTKGVNYRDTDNFYYIDNGNLIRNKLKSRIKNFKILPFPDRDIYDYQSIINNYGGMATIITSRGCPFHCTYCCNHAIARVYKEDMNIIRYNCAERILAEIEYMKSRYKFDRLWFIDDLFILDKARLDKFLPEYKKRFNTPFACQIRPNITTRETLFKLKENGCYRVFLAVESANDYIRNVVMKRNITKSQLENTFRWAQEAGIETLSVNIIGVPGDTEETIMETIEFHKRMNPSLVGVNIFNPYEGTELGNYCKKNNMIRDIEPRFFFDRRQSRVVLPTISNKKLMKLYDRFEYLIYKDNNPAFAKKILWVKRYKKLENNILVGFLFNKIRTNKFTKMLGRKLKMILIKQ